MRMAGWSFYRFARYVFCTAMAMWALFSFRVAEAFNPNRPSLMQGSADTAQVDQGVNRIVEFLAYFAYAGSAIAVLAGLVVCLPIIGNTQLGMKAIKGGVLVGAATGVVHVLFAFLGGVFR
ncbi:MAG: hypothetical protein LAT63_16640 [Marinobacter sp.]|nr:hypothetical protein [Marinobacter sp.]